jgi:hypothetical protein
VRLILYIFVCTHRIQVQLRVGIHCSCTKLPAPKGSIHLNTYAILDLYICPGNVVLGRVRHPETVRRVQVHRRG